MRITPVDMTGKTSATIADQTQWTTGLVLKVTGIGPKADRFDAKFTNTAMTEPVYRVGRVYDDLAVLPVPNPMLTAAGTVTAEFLDVTVTFYVVEGSKPDDYETTIREDVDTHQPMIADILGEMETAAPSWDSITGKPSTYPPSAHKHGIEDVQGLREELDGKPDEDTNTTYTLTKTGNRITLAGSDGSSASVTDSDTNTTYGNATQGVAGLMSPSDKAKLDGIAAGANNVTKVSQLQNDSGYQTRSQLEAAISQAVASVYKVMGSCARADLPKSPAVGDVWNLTDEDGMNVVWNGDSWDELGAPVVVSWDAIQGKPSTFTPSSHTHTKSQITDFPSSMPASDVYAWAKAKTKPTYTASEVGAAPASHTHDDRYYTESEVDSKLNGKANSSHTHDAATESAAGFMSAADKKKLDGLAEGANRIVVDSALSSTSTNPVQNKVVNSALSGKAPSGHTHNSIVSRGRVTAESGTNNPAVSGASMSEVYNNGYPISYGNLLTLCGPGKSQLLLGWSGTSGANAPAYIRSKRDTSDASWSPWAKIYTSVDKPTASDVGAAPSSHTHSASDITSGTLGSDRLPTVPISKGGTGKTTAKAANNAVCGSLTEETGALSDDTLFAGAYMNPSDTNGGIYKRKASTVWNYILSKIRSTFGFSTSNVLPVSHGGTGATSASTARTNLGAAASNHTHTTLMRESLSGKTLSLNTLTLSSGTPHIAHYYCPTDGGGSNITGRPSDSNKYAFELTVELIRWASTSDYITKQTYTRGNEHATYVRYCTSGSWTGWSRMATTSDTVASATKAVQDNRGQQIDSTYIKALSVSGRTVTYTRGNGTTGSFQTQDTNTTYEAITSAEIEALFD